MTKYSWIKKLETALLLIIFFCVGTIAQRTFLSSDKKNPQKTMRIQKTKKSPNPLEKLNSFFTSSSESKNNKKTKKKKPSSKQNTHSHLKAKNNNNSFKSSFYTPESPLEKKYLNDSDISSLVYMTYWNPIVFKKLDYSLQETQYKKSIEYATELIKCFTTDPYCGQKSEENGYFDLALSPLHRNLSTFLNLSHSFNSIYPGHKIQFSPETLIEAMNMESTTIPTLAFENLLQQDPDQMVLKKALTTVQKQSLTSRVNLTILFAHQNHQSQDLRKKLITSIAQALTDKNDLMTSELMAENLHLISLDKREIKNLQKITCPQILKKSDTEKILKFQFKKYNLKMGCS